MTDPNAMEILSHDDFWAKDPAPGTVFFELGTSGLELVGVKVDPEVDDPSNAVMVKGMKTALAAKENYAVLKWGDWSTPENQTIWKLRNEAQKLMEEEIHG